MSPLDISIVAAYFIVSIVIALYFYKRAGENRDEFFLMGRSMPWWIAGTGMVATTFAADTPLAVAELVAKGGISGNWLWWNMVAGNMLTVFFFARLWRRSGIMTDVEFIELRYSGPEAAFLRGFRAVYLGLFMNSIIMGWVNVALAEILTNIFGLSGNTVFFFIIGSMAIVGVYSAISGLWGVAYTDVFQFILAMTGCIVLAVVILDLPQIGGISGMMTKLPPHMFDFFPQIGLSSGAAAGITALSFSAFTAHIFVQWWASWYPGSEPGGGGYVAQRIMSAKDERHSLLSALWFSMAHFALRPWPWIIVGLAAVILYPDLAADSKKTGYILAMRDHLPSGLLGLLVAAFLAAYMSTISTHLNWGSSYLINDLYRRFIKKNADEKHYIFITRLVTIGLVIISSGLIFFIKSISGAWSFIIEAGAGLGLVLILRWYWWRINAWSEITAMIAPFFGYAAAKFFLDLKFPESLFFITAFTTVAWVFMTFITKETDSEKLKEFYIKVKPSGPGWNKIREKYSFVYEENESLAGSGINWILGIVLVYSFLFGIGKLIFKEPVTGSILIIISFIIFFIINIRLRREFKR